MKGFAPLFMPLSKHRLPAHWLEVRFVLYSVNINIYNNTNMSNINFKPWIGKNYLTKGYQGKRILVLGESHYCSKELSEGGRC